MTLQASLHSEMLWLLLLLFVYSGKILTVSYLLFIVAGLCWFPRVRGKGYVEGGRGTWKQQRKQKDCFFSHGYLILRLTTSPLNCISNWSVWLFLKHEPEHCLWSICGFLLSPGANPGSFPWHRTGHNNQLLISCPSGFEYSKFRTMFQRRTCISVLVKMQLS